MTPIQTKLVFRMAAPIRTTLAVSFVLMLATISLAQPPGATDAAGVAIPPAEESVQTTAGGATLKFNFTAADWPSVLTWFAEQAELSLQLDVAPSGSFTYIDPDRAYSINDAMDVPNLSLLKRGYVAVRRGRLLQLIDLEVENADKLISEIAELVPPMMLETRGKSDVVSTVFPLGGMTPAAAKEELAQLIGPWGRVIVLESAGQVKVTETAEKLMGIRDVLESTASAQTTVTVITLQHRAAEEILEIARPLLGLEAGMMSNDDIRIALSLLGDKMYVTGRPGKVGLLQALVDEADKSLVSETVTDEAAVTPKFKTHAVSTADPTTVFDVLQTLLAGTPDARITIEPNTQSIIAFARPETHALITDTIAEMEGQQKTLRVFTLKRLDPAQALLTINKFFGVDAEGNGRGPTIDGNPEDGKLWVRGTERQIELVDTLLQELEGQDSIAGLAGKVRMLPIGGKPDTREAIERAIQLWPITGRKNGIRQMPSRGDDTPRQQVIPERRSRDDLSASRRVHPHSGVTATRLIQTPVDDTIPTSLNLSDDIVIQFTPGGLMIASEDLEALDEFQLLVESLTADDLPSDVPTIFWLKYAEAEPTAELISSILGGSQSSVGSVVDSATSGMGGGMLGGLLGLAGGGDDESPAKSVLTAAGSVSIVPDARLNALIIQAGAADIALIEMLIEKIDIADSPEDIQVKAKPAIIPVIYQNAQDVATVVKEALGDRIEGAEKSNSRGGGGRGGSPDPADFIAALRGGGGGRKADAEKTKSEANKINIAVDKKANALIVVASPQDFEEVRDLVATLDEAGADLEETIETVTVGGNINPEVMKAALSSILGPNVTTTTAGKTDGKTAAATPGSNSSGSTSSSDSDTQNAADIQRRMEFFRALRSGGGGGGAPGGGGGGRGGGGGFGGERGGDRGGRGGGN